MKKPSTLNGDYTPTTKCVCGLPLHYTKDEEGCKLHTMVEAFVHRLGPDTPVTTPSGTWMVPRHYIALHGIRGSTLAEIAAQYGFKKIG